MGKYGNYTGCKLLGEELARLRGDRTLDQVAQLSRTPPFTDRVKPVSAATLCQIENGVSLPSLDTLYTLSVLYQVSAQQLLDLTVQQRLTDKTVLPETLEETRTLFHETFTACKYYEAMTYAVHAERLADTPAGQLAWRANRAHCMDQLGMRPEAIWILEECVHDPDATPEQRTNLHRNLAAALLSVGQTVPAREHARVAYETLADDASVGARAEAVMAVAECAHAAFRDGVDKSPRDVRRCLVLIAEARNPALSVRWSLSLDFAESLTHGLLGNHLLLLDGLRRLRKAAAASGIRHLQYQASYHLGVALAERGDFAAARSCFVTAESVCLELDAPELIFEISFELYRLANETGDDAAVRYLKRCERYRPLVSSKSPAVRSYDLLQRAGK